MNTLKIYNAQLNVSRCYTVETITNLIDELSIYTENAYYNNETRSIDIEVDEGNNISNDDIKYTIKSWLYTLPTDRGSIDIIAENINIVFNITRINNENNEIIKVYLY